MWNRQPSRAGKREDLHGLYVRSSWEANYARYLNWLIKHKQIAGWEYEADCFEFLNIRKGTRFYTPDFKIINLDASIEYHEVKGYMDQKSRTKLDRFRRHYPDIKLVVIGVSEYREIARKLARMIPGWENSALRSY